MDPQKQARLAILEQRRTHLREVADSSQGVEANLLHEGKAPEAAAQRQRTAEAKAELSSIEFEIQALLADQ